MVLLLIALLACGTAGPAAAQGPAAGPSCAVVSVEEVNAIFGGADLGLEDNSARYYCSFDGSFDLTISVMTDTDLAAGTTGFGDGVAVTVGGAPAWWQESSGNLAVAANRSVVFMNGWGSADTSEEMLALLSELGALIAPRIPPGPDPALAAQLEALLPPSVPRESAVAVPGWYLLPPDAGTPEVLALQGLLASQGRSSADLVLVAGSDDAGGSAFVAAVPGLDPSALLMLLLNTILPGAASAPVSIVEIGGRQVTRIETEPPLFGFVSGDAVVYATGSDAFVASVIGPTD